VKQVNEIHDVKTSKEEIRLANAKIIWYPNRKPAGK
jgi:hypothetical protein